MRAELDTCPNTALLWYLAVRVLLADLRLDDVDQGIHQPVTFPQLPTGLAPL